VQPAVQCPSCASDTTVIGASRHFTTLPGLGWLVRLMRLPAAWHRHECWECGAVYRAEGPAARQQPRKGRDQVPALPITTPIATPADEIASSIAHETRRRGGRPALRPVAQFVARREVLQRDARALGREAVAQLKGKRS
jgi:hypothetical protein